MQPPERCADLASLAEARRRARAAEREATAALRAAVVRAHKEGGRTEAELARAAGIDRMTARKWLGK